jgi:cytochrome c-type biogenesis protein CcmH
LIASARRPLYFQTVLVRLLALLLLASSSAWAVTPDERLADPALEARARGLSQELRCLVCQNQSIDDSNAGLARDLRILVRERLMAGDSDREVIEYLTNRYGDFVLLRPAMKPSTIALWFAPAVVLLLGATGVVVFFRRRRAVAEVPPLSPEEQRRLASLVEER